MSVGPLKSLRRRLRMAIEAFFGDPSPFRRPAPHIQARHGDRYRDFTSGQWWQYDARRGTWRVLPIDGSATAEPTDRRSRGGLRNPRGSADRFVGASADQTSGLPHE